MIDFSKYEKVYEWEHVYGITMNRRFLSSTVVYLIRIGDDCYIDDTYNFSTLVRKHLRDLVHEVHPNKKMQEAYNKCKSCEFYILAQVGLFEHAEKIRQQFVDRFSPSLNVGDFEFKSSTKHWSKDEEDSVELKIKIPYEEIKRMQEIVETQGIPLEKFVQASAVAVLNGYSYRNSDRMTPEGIALIDNALCSPYL